MKHTKGVSSTIIRFLLILSILNLALLSSCAVKNPSRKTKPLEKKEKIDVVISFEPSPAYAEKAVGVKVNLSFEAKKVVLYLEGASDFLKDGYVMKRINPTTFIGSFIAPYEGTYPVKLLIKTEKGTTVSVVPEGSPLRVIGRKTREKSAEKMIEDYIKDYLERLPSNYVSITIEEIEPVKTTAEGKIYRVRFVGEKYTVERIKEEKTMYFLFKEGAGGSYLEFLGENLP